MKKNNSKPFTAKTAAQLAEALGLPQAVGAEIEFKSDLNDKIIEIVEKRELTHAQVAKLAKTSRTRITAIMNRNTFEISSDLLLRILAALGVQVKARFQLAA